MFEKETGNTVEVTKSNNEEMIAKLRATGGGGFDLVQPSQDRHRRTAGRIRDIQAIDLSKIDAAQFIPSMLEATKANTTVDGEVYGVHMCGGPADLCSTPPRPPA